MKRRSFRGAVTLIRRLRSHVVILLALASVTGGWWFQRLDFPAEPKPTSIDYPGFTVANHGSDVAVAITFIAVVSMQRSSSTFLSHQVLAGEEGSEKLARTPISACPLHHFISLNEIFQTYEQQSGDAWSIEGKELLNGGQRKVFDLTALELAAGACLVQRRTSHSSISKLLDCACAVLLTATTGHRAAAKHTPWRHGAISWRVSCRPARAPHRRRCSSCWTPAILSHKIFSDSHCRVCLSDAIVVCHASLFERQRALDIFRC